LNADLLGTAPPELLGRVSSLNSAFQNLVASLAIATFATDLGARMAALDEARYASAELLHVGRVTALAASFSERARMHASTHRGLVVRFGP